MVLQKDGSYVPTSKFWSSPRVVLRQKILKKEAEKLQKARKAQAEMAGKSKVDSVVCVQERYAKFASEFSLGAVKIVA